MLFIDVSEMTQSQILNLAKHFLTSRQLNEKKSLCVGFFFHSDNWNTVPSSLINKIDRFAPARKRHVGLLNYKIYKTFSILQ